MTSAETGPSIGIEQLDVESLAGGQWRIVWRLVNHGARPLEVLAAWLPHGRFRSSEWRLDPPLPIAPGAEAFLPSAARFSEPEAAEVENAFIILRVTSAGESWQVFGRLRVRAGAQGAPEAETESITAQREGSMVSKIEP